MTTPQQPDDELKVEPDVIKDLDVPGDDADNIVGGFQACSRTGMQE